MPTNGSSLSGASSQRGVALVICLIVLLLLTLIGITAMSDTALQDRMSANANDRAAAFQAAVAAARSAEERVRNAQLPTAGVDTCNPVGGFYQSAACSGVQWKRNWRSGIGVYDYAPDSAEEDDRLGRVEARYIIEQLPPDTDAQGGSLVIGGNETDRRRPVYRITANATYADGSTQVTVQTTYQPYQ